jgi:hypothetical protein
VSDVFVSEYAGNGLFGLREVELRLFLFQVDVQVGFGYALGAARDDVLERELIVHLISVHDYFLVCLMLEKCQYHLVCLRHTPDAVDFFLEQFYHIFYVHENFVLQFLLWDFSEFGQLNFILVSLLINWFVQRLWIFHTNII